MRIALLGEASVVHTRRWAEYFQSRGDAVKLFTLETPPPDFAVDWEKVGRRNRFHAISYTLARSRMARALDDFDPDLVNAHFLPNYGWLGVLAGRRPLAVSAWGSDVLVNPGKSPFHRWRLRFVLERADLITSDAEMMSEEIRRHVDGSTRLLTAPMGIERVFFERGEARRERDAVILQDRHLEPIYDVRTLLRALPAFFETHPAWRVRIAGEGSRRPKLEREARRLSLDGRVEFLGRLSRARLVDELLRARLYVSTSLSDSTSVSLLEAMALGAHPVVSDLPANREWLTDPEQGFFFPAGDAPALSAALDSAAGLTDDRRRAAAARNRSVIADRAIWEENMERVRETFLELLKEKP